MDIPDSTYKGDRAMKHAAFAFAATVFAALALAAPSALAAESYKVDPVHSSAVFRIRHANIGYVWGRFNDPAGTFTLDESDPSKSSFNIEIKVENVDTHNAQRDTHLKSPDFFNAKQHPTIAFKSTSVTKGEGNTLQATGTLTIHGVTKTVTVPVEVTGKGQFPPGTARAGIEATFAVKLADFEMKTMGGMIGAEARVVVALEGVKQ
jgi:polyisoprenoid-binding protein YceI